MKFGQQLESYIHEASAFGAPLFVNYNQLKQHIRTRRVHHRLHDIMETAAFKRGLRKAIATVNCFFTRMEAELLSRGADRTSSPSLLAQVMDLMQYALLNYVAILKLLKKHDKHCSTSLYAVVERILRTQPFVKALLASPLFYPPTVGGAAEPHAPEVTCGICLEPRVQLQPLACAHEFCTLCLAKAAAAELHACPLCRSPQSLHPIEVSLTRLNLSLKYSPRTTLAPDAAAPAGCEQPALGEKLALAAAGGMHAPPPPLPAAEDAAPAEASPCAPADAANAPLTVAAPSAALEAAPPACGRAARSARHAWLHAHFGHLELSAALARLAMSAAALSLAWSLFAGRASPAASGAGLAATFGASLGSHDDNGALAIVLANAH